MDENQEIKYFDNHTGKVSCTQTIGSIPITKEGLVPFKDIHGDSKLMALDEYFNKIYHHKFEWIHINGEEVPIDIKLVPLITELNKIGLETLI